MALRPELRLDEEGERARLALHRNSPGDAGYRAFLARLVDPLCKRLPQGAEGLDFGCGPGPVLAGMLEELGAQCESYDPLFAPNPAALARSWDFVTATEVAEHLRDPRAAWEQMVSLLRPNGWLAVMTQPLTPQRELNFRGWSYAHDPTHVALYRTRTMEWIAAWQGLELETPREDVFLFRRSPRRL